jgi:hypothetical protein
VSRYDHSRTAWSRARKVATYRVGVSSFEVASAVTDGTGGFNDVK